MEINTNIQAEMHARVFRRMQKPKHLPTWIWLRLPKISLFGRWEDLGKIASTQDGNLSVRQPE